MFKYASIGNTHFELEAIHPDELTLARTGNVMLREARHRRPEVTTDVYILAEEGKGNLVHDGRRWDQVATVYYHSAGYNRPGLVAKVNWSAMGSQSPDTARDFAHAVNVAATVADWYSQDYSFAVTYETTATL